jgi:hypothetical protein
MTEHGTTSNLPDEIIMTFTGRIVHPLAITPDDIDIRDIAHALSMKCRYTGHCKKHYSVGQHSVLMARWPLPGPAAWRLLHDTSEAYLPDIASPIKGRFPLMKRAEAAILRAVATKFNLPAYETVYPQVHQADTWLLTWEGRNNMHDTNKVGIWWHIEAPTAVLDHDFRAWSPAKTERMFLKEAQCLLKL